MGCGPVEAGFVARRSASSPRAQARRGGRLYLSISAEDEETVGIEAAFTMQGAGGFRSDSSAAASGPRPCERSSCCAGGASETEASSRCGNARARGDA